MIDDELEDIPPSNLFHFDFIKNVSVANQLYELKYLKMKHGREYPFLLRYDNKDNLSQIYIKSKKLNISA